MRAPNLPVSTVTSGRPQELDKGVEQRFGPISRHGAIEARAATLADRPGEGELRDREHSATDLVETEVHPAVGVRKHPQRRQPACRPLELRLAVTPLEPDQDQETDADPADHLAIDPHLGPGHPLDDHLHVGHPVLNADTSKLSSLPPSSVTRPT